MSGPWEDFAPQERPPWEDFGSARPKEAAPPTAFENFIARFAPDWMAGSEGGVRGSMAGRVAMGMADPGVAVAQAAANLLPDSTGIPEAVNQRIRDVSGQYEQARGEAGSTGFDPARLAGNIAITAPLMTVGAPAATLSGMAGRGALQGGVMGALNPVVEGDGFWGEKAQQAGTGAVVGGIAAPAVGAVARLLSPAASVNPQLALLRSEGVKPTVGQTLGGWANRAEEKLQSVPLVGDAITAARQRGAEQLERAALNRGAAPVGATVGETGGAGVKELSDKIGKAYEAVLPKMHVNVLDPGFVNKIANLRQMVQTLPQKEAGQFDAILEREIGGRTLPNGTLAGQELKSAWNALRDLSKTLEKSNDAYQSQLGRALKQTFTELKGHVTASNTAADVAALRNADFAWANYKRAERAASSVAADGGHFTPAQLHSAVKALDRSKDRGAFGKQQALMQDLSAAGKSILTNKVPNSGTFDRAIMGALALGTPVAPSVTLPLIGAAAAGNLAYTQPVQNFLRFLITARPDMAPQIAQWVRLGAGPAAFIGAAAEGQR